MTGVLLHFYVISDRKPYSIFKGQQREKRLIMSDGNSSHTHAFSHAAWIEVFKYIAHTLYYEECCLLNSP